MNGAEMVLGIVAIATIGKVMQAKYGITRDWRVRGPNRFASDDDHALIAENNQLRDEMKGMKERIQVLERLATDDESDARRLDREIEKLRDARPSGKTES